MATWYYRTKGSDTWHWCNNCSNFPTSNLESKCTDGRPSGELCNECKAKEKNGNCTTRKC